MYKMIASRRSPRCAWPAATRRRTRWRQRRPDDQGGQGRRKAAGVRSGDHQRQRFDLPEAVPGARDRGVHQGQPTTKVNYGAGGSGKGRQDFADMVTDYGCTDAPVQGRGRGQDQGRRVPVLPDPARRDHGQLQRRRRRQAPAVGRRRSRRSSSARSRSGTTRRSPPTTRARSCRTPTSSSRTAPTARARPSSSRCTSTTAAPDAWKLKSGVDGRVAGGHPGR